VFCFKTLPDGIAFFRAFIARWHHTGDEKMAVSVKDKSTKQLREERAAILTKAQAFHSANEDNWTAECESQWSEMLSDASTLASAADRRDTIQGMMGGEAGNDGASHHDDPRTIPGRRQDRKQATVQIRAGYDASGKPKYIERPVGPRGEEAYQAAFADFLKTGSPSAALQSDDAEQAGYLLASEQFAAELLKEVDDLVFVRRYARIHTVLQATTLGIRARTARAATFNWSSELQVSAEDTSLKYGKRVLEPHHLTGQIKISRDLLRRSVVPVEAEVRGELARDAGEAMEDAYLTGNGFQKPLGVFTASDDGISTSRDVNTGSATGFTGDGLLSAKYALKGQYRRGQRGPVRWLFHRDAISLIAKLKDATNGQYLFRVGMGRQQDNTAPEDELLGFPVDESERVPNTFTNGLYSGMLCNWRYYEIADALEMDMQVLFELYAQTNQVGYIGRIKTDGMPTLQEAFVRLKCAT
jgi:HK97 family phage major capsid protein